MLYPENLEQTVAIVRSAREQNIAIIPLSSASPHLHRAYTDPHAEIVCFSKMNRIIKIDRRSRYVRIEPGVTFAQLVPTLKDAGMRLNMPFFPRAGKSAVASALERDAVLIPKYQYDYTDPLLTVEAVCGTGEVLRTGSAAGPGPVEELKADMVLPWGPGCIDYLRFFSGAQGTFGLVTWATLKTEVLPRASKLFFIASETPNDLVQLSNALLLSRIPDECIIMNRVNFAAAFADSEEEEAHILAAAPPWLLLLRICGFERYPLERIEIYEQMLYDACADLRLQALCELSGLDGLERKVEAMLTDCDRRETYWKLRRGAERELDMLAPPSKTPALAELLSALEAACGETVGITIQPQTRGRAYRLEADIFFDGESTAQVEKALSDILLPLHEAGAYFDRPYASMTELVYGNDPVSAAALQRLKNIFDPDNILAPGRLCFSRR